MYNISNELYFMVCLRKFKITSHYVFFKIFASLILCKTFLNGKQFFVSVNHFAIGGHMLCPFH